MPLPCSPVSHSDNPSQEEESSSDESLTTTTPRPGPADPRERSREALSTNPFLKSGIGSARKDILEEGSKARQPSISFSPQSYPPKPMAESSYISPSRIAEDDPEDNMSPRGGQRRPISQDDVAESSADESTAIFRSSRAASARGNHYGSTNANGNEGDAETTRQRKNGTVKSRPRGPVEEHEEDEKHESWFKSLVEKYGSVELENKGSVARDHLALERTFLAWLRTSLSFASIGIAITQLFRLNTTIASQNPDTKVEILFATAKLRSVGKPLGATFLGISIVILLLGFHRYFESQHYVIRGKFPASRGTILIVSAVAAALIITSLVVVIAVAPQAFET